MILLWLRAALEDTCSILSYEARCRISENGKLGKKELE